MTQEERDELNFFESALGIKADNLNPKDLQRMIVLMKMREAEAVRHPKIHNVKVMPNRFEAIKNRQKRFEIRLNDRDYRTGDDLILEEYDEDHTGRWIRAQIIYTDDYEQRPDYIVLGLSDELYYGENGEGEKGTLIPMVGANDEAFCEGYQQCLKDFKTVSASEAVYGFASWLTTRKEVLSIGSIKDASKVAALVGEFCRSQGFTDPKDDFVDRLKPYPREKKPVLEMIGIAGPFPMFLNPLGDAYKSKALKRRPSPEQVARAVQLYIDNGNMPVKKGKFRRGYYRLYHPSEDRPTLVYYYFNPDAKRWGFGFNIADGGGWVCEDDLSSESTAVRVELVEKGM